MQSSSEHFKMEGEEEDRKYRSDNRWWSIFTLVRADDDTEQWSSLTTDSSIMTPLNPMAGGGLRDEWWDEITLYPACTLTDTYTTYIHKIHTQQTNITFLHKETNSILECHFWSVECSGVQRPVDARDKLYDLDGCSEPILWFWNSHSCLSIPFVNACPPKI